MTVTGGTVTFAAESAVKTMTVTGAATVAPASATATYALTAVTAVIGTAATEIADSANNATVNVTVAGNGSAVVYGTAAGVTVSAPSAETRTSTALYTVGNDGNHLFATEYSATTSSGTVATTATFVLSSLTVTGQNFLGWYTAAEGGTVLMNTNTIGSYSSIYALFSAKTYTVTFGYTEGAVYLVNGAQTASGQYTYAYGTVLSVSVIAADGYSADGATVSVNGGTSAASQSLTVTDNATVSAAGITENPAPSDSGLTLTDYLLVVLVVITAVVAIAVVMKLLRK